MKHFLFLGLSAISMLSLNNLLPIKTASPGQLVPIENYEGNEIAFQDEEGSGSGKMSATVFKNQQFCRAELKDFPFDAAFLL